MEKMDGMSMDLKAENIAQLKALFPEAVTEGKVDFEVLKALLGGEIEQRQEYYKFTWNGKEAARAYARTRSMGTLRPCVEESSGKDGTAGKFDSDNLYIEGDNLEVLKLLQGPYHKRVKMIYIDPPYNTGHDFVYPDNFRDSIGNYKALTGQTDDEGKSTRANPETSGRYHTDWLNMMYPRLILARNLLTDDGVIFISIDDSEQDNLKKLCNEVFGEENYLGTLPRVTKKSGKAHSETFAQNHDFVVVFSKNLESISFSGVDADDNQYPLEDEFVEIRGKYKLNQTLDYDSLWYNPTMDFPIQVGDETFYPGGDLQKHKDRKNGNHATKDWVWRWSKAKFDFGFANGFVVVKEGNGRKRIYTKTYQKASIQKNDGKYFVEIKERKNNISSLEYVQNDYSNDNAKKDLSAYDLGTVFDFPKPVSLILSFAGLCSLKSTDIFLDFFAGSSSSADAILIYNMLNNSHVKHISVQLPECVTNGFKNICEIGKERIRRAAKKVVSDKWEVISKEEKAKYGCKELSRSDCLAKGNECGNNDLFSGEKTAERGTVCAVGSNAAGGGIYSLQHSGGTSTELDQGISAISGNSTGEQGRTGNATPSLRPSELPCPYGHFGSHGATSGSGQDAPCPYKNTNRCPLITKYCSDMGFKVFKLDTSNLLPWNPNADELEQNLFAAVDNVLEGRTTDDLLYEILLKCNLPLTLPIEKKVVGSGAVSSDVVSSGVVSSDVVSSGVVGSGVVSSGVVGSDVVSSGAVGGGQTNTIYLVGAGALAICLDKNIPATIAEEIVKLRDEYAPIVPMQVVFRDNGFNDVTKTNALQILKQAGFEEKSIQTI